LAVYNTVSMMRGYTNIKGVGTHACLAEAGEALLKVKVFGASFLLWREETQGHNP